jgi:hypothetical protein
VNDVTRAAVRGTFAFDPAFFGFFAEAGRLVFE